MSDRLKKLYEEGQPVEQVQQQPAAPAAPAPLDLNQLYEQGEPVDPTWTQRWGQAWDKAMDAFDSPEVREEYKTVEGFYDDPYLMREEYGTGVDPVTAKAGWEGAKMLGSGIYANLIAAPIDKFGEKIGLGEDDLPDIPLHEMQYKALVDEADEITKSQLTVSSNSRIGQYGIGGKMRDLTPKQEARLDEIGKQIAAIEANDPGIRDRWIPTDPPWSHYVEKYMSMPESATGQAYAGALGAAMHPAMEAEEWATDKLTSGIEDERQREYAKDNLSGAIGAGSMVVGPYAGAKALQLGGKAGSATLRGAKDAAAAGRRAFQDFRYSRKDLKADEKIKEIDDYLAMDEETTARIMSEYSDPELRLAMLRDHKEKVQKWTDEKAKLEGEKLDRAVQIERRDNPIFANEADMKGLATNASLTSGQRSTARQLLDHGKKNAIGYAGTIVTDAAISAIGIPPILTAGKATRAAGQAIGNIIRDGRDVQTKFADLRDSGINIPTRSFDDLIDSLPATDGKQLQAWKDGYEAGILSEDDVVKLVDRWVADKQKADPTYFDDVVEAKKTPAELRAEQAELETQTQAEIDQAKALEQERLRKRDERRNKEQADIEYEWQQEYAPVDQNAPFEELQLRQQEAQLAKEALDAEIAQGTKAVKEKFESVDPEDHIKMANARLNLPNRTPAQRYKDELIILRAEAARDGVPVSQKALDELNKRYRGEATGIYTPTPEELAQANRYAKEQGAEAVLDEDITPASSKGVDMTPSAQSLRDLVAGRGGRGTGTKFPSKNVPDAPELSPNPFTVNQLRERAIREVPEGLEGQQVTPKPKPKVKQEIPTQDLDLGGGSRLSVPKGTMGMVAKVDKPSDAVWDKMTKTEKQDYYNRKDTQERNARDARSNPTFKEIFEEKPKTPAEEALAEAVEKVIFEKKLTSDIGGTYNKWIEVDYGRQMSSTGLSAETLLRQVARDARREQQGLDIPADSPLRTLVDEPTNAQKATAREDFLADVNGDIDIVDNAARALEEFFPNKASWGDGVKQVNDLVNAAREVYATVNKNKTIPDDMLTPQIQKVKSDATGTAFNKAQFLRNLDNKSPAGKGVEYKDVWSGAQGKYSKFIDELTTDKRVEADTNAKSIRGAIQVVETDGSVRMLTEKEANAIIKDIDEAWNAKESANAGPMRQTLMRSINNEEK